MTDDTPIYMKPIPMVNVNADDRPTRPTPEKAEWDDEIDGIHFPSCRCLNQLPIDERCTNKRADLRAAVQRALDKQ